MQCGHGGRARDTRGTALWQRGLSSVLLEQSPGLGPSGQGLRLGALPWAVALTRRGPGRWEAVHGGAAWPGFLGVACAGSEGTVGKQGGLLDGWVSPVGARGPCPVSRGRPFLLVGILDVTVSSGDLPIQGRQDALQSLQRSICVSELWSRTGVHRCGVGVTCHCFQWGHSVT